jgi:WD40 repeat protein
MTPSSGDLTKLDDQNPWPGLAAYEEASSDFFFGRSEEAAEVFRLIRLAPLTVVYGKSGLGKTSLLQAGLYPLLRAGRYLPIHLRIDFSVAANCPPLRQVMQRLKEELDRAKADYPAPGHDEGLWEYLHRKDLEIWSQDNVLLTPVLVFDQFEELFSRGGSNVELIQQVFDGLADLIENRIPAEIASNAPGPGRLRLDLLSQRYRIVLSFREDFLSEVRTWEQKVPSLLRNCLRLDPMSHQRAIEAVERAGKAILCKGVAPCIVDFVGKLDQEGGATDPSSLTVEPLLLSLCCYQLNRRRKPGAQIDEALVREAGQDILDGFYREALDDEAVKGPPEVASFIEGYLIQGDHFRGAYPRKGALDENLLTEKQLTVLTDKHRLLRIVPYPDTTRVELIHDRLVPVVRKARDERKIKQHQDEQERLAREAQAERDKERARSEELQRERDTARHSLAVARVMRNIVAGAGIVIVILSLLFWNVAQQQKAEAEKRAEEREAEAQKRETESAKTAVSMETARLGDGRLALPAGMEPLEQTMYRGLAAYRLSGRDLRMSQAGAASLTALHWVMERTGHLRKAVTIGNLVPTTALAYSPDDKTFAVGGEDGLIRLLDAETYRETGRLDCGQSATEAVWSLAYNSDGTRLAVGYSSNDNERTGSGLVCVFDMLQRKRLHAWSDKNTPADVYSVAYGGTPGSEFVISGGSDKILRLFDLKTGEVHKFPHKQLVVAVAVSMDSRLMASGDEEGIIRLWNPGKPKAIGELKGHEAMVQQVVFSPTDPNLLVSGGDDGLIMVWNVKERCLAQQSKQQLAKIVNLAVSIDGLIAAAGADGNVRLFWLSKNGASCSNSKGKKPAAVPKTPELVVIPDGELSGHGGFVLGAAFNREGGRLATTGQDGSIRIWGYKTPGFSLAQLNLESDGTPASARPGQVTTLAISFDGKTIAAGTDEGNVFLWDRPRENTDPLSQPPVASWRAHDKAIHGLAFTWIENQLAIVSGGDDGVLRRWGVVSRKPIGQDMEDKAKPVRSIGLSPDGKTLAAGSSDGTIRLWDVETGNLVRQFEKPTDAQADYELYAVSFSGDGKYLAIGDKISLLRVVDLEKPNSERMLPGHTDAITSVSRGGARWLLSAGRDGRVFEWEQTVLKGPTTVGLKKHDEFKFRLGVRSSSPLISIDTSRDGGLILTGGHDGRLELWDGDKHVQIAERFLGHESRAIVAVALAPDGSFFVTADAETILVWPGPNRWANIICSKLVWNMSKKQWREWVSKYIEPLDQCPELPIQPDAPAQQLNTAAAGEAK